MAVFPYRRRRRRRRGGTRHGAHKRLSSFSPALAVVIGFIYEHARVGEAVSGGVGRGGEGKTIVDVIILNRREESRVTITRGRRSLCSARKTT